MAIQPIDLQTMYSQLSNVSKSMSTQQQAQLTEAMQQQNKIQQNIEKTNKVQQTTNDKGNSKKIDSNGGNGSGSYGGKKQNKKAYEQEKDESENNPVKSDYSYIGTIIDITR